MCRDRQRTEVHLSGSSSSGHRRMTETTGRDDTKKETKKESDKDKERDEGNRETYRDKETGDKLRRRRRNLKQVHLKLLRQKRRLLRPVRRIKST